MKTLSFYHEAYDWLDSKFDQQTLVGEWEPEDVEEIAEDLYEIDFADEGEQAVRDFCHGIREARSDVR